MVSTSQEFCNVIYNFLRQSSKKIRELIFNQYCNKKIGLCWNKHITLSILDTGSIYIHAGQIIKSNVYAEI
jgi:hypothetical protein